jgi:hypothetical protein
MISNNNAEVFLVVILKDHTLLIAIGKRALPALPAEAAC